jgi:gluconolactonase
MAMTTPVYTRPTKSILPTTSMHLAPQPAIAPTLPPDHVSDLMTAAGCAELGARWRAREAKLVECPALADSMPEFRTTYDVDPHAELLGFDDSAWPEIEPPALAARRGGGMVSFFWFRTRITIPATIGDFAAAGSKAVFTTNVDDYAEVWINGVLPRTPGRPSPAAIQGFNMPNRLVLGDAVKAGEVFEIAVFAINGPISAAPANFLWFREAKVEFYR